MARAINKLKGEPLEMCVKGELRTRENNEPDERDDELTTGTGIRYDMIRYLAGRADSTEP